MQRKILASAGPFRGVHFEDPILAIGCKFVALAFFFRQLAVAGAQPDGHFRQLHPSASATPSPVVRNNKVPTETWIALAGVFAAVGFGLLLLYCCCTRGWRACKEYVGNLNTVAPYPGVRSTARAIPQRSTPTRTPPTTFFSPSAEIFHTPAPCRQGRDHNSPLKPRNLSGDFQEAPIAIQPPPAPQKVSPDRHVSFELPRSRYETPAKQMEHSAKEVPPEGDPEKMFEAVFLPLGKEGYRPAEPVRHDGNSGAFPLAPSDNESKFG